MPKVTKYWVRQTKDEHLSVENSEEILFFDPVTQLQSLLGNASISSKLLVVDRYKDKGIKSDVTTGFKFHSLFQQALKAGKIP